MATLAAAVAALAVAQLTANLTRSEFRAMHVDVGRSSANQRNELLEFSGGGGRCPSDPVGGRIPHVFFGQMPFYPPGALVGRIVDIASGRIGVRGLVDARVTQPEDDGAAVLWMSDVDVRLPDVSFEILERQRVIDWVPSGLISALNVPVAVVETIAGASFKPLRNSRLAPHRI